MNKEIAENENRGPGWEEYDEAVKLLEKGEPTMAAAGFHNAIKDFEVADNKKGIANAASRLADICLEREEYPRALEMLARVEEICTADHDRLSLMSINKRKAQALLKTNDYQAATELYLDLIEEYHQLNNPDGTVKALAALSDCYRAAGDRDKAADALKTAASIHRNFGHKRHAADLEEQAAKILGN